MARRGEVTILEGLPGFPSVRAAILRFASTPGSVLTSSNSALIAQARDLIEHDENLLAAHELGQIEIRPLGELVKVLADASDVPLAPVANTEHQVAVSSLAAAELSEDSPFYESRNLPGFHEAILETLQELRREGIETAGIEELSHKVRNVAFIEKSFDEHLEKLRMTTLSHRLLKMLDCEPKRTQSLRNIYWLGETQWPELWLQFAEWVLKAGINIAFLAERHLTEQTFFRSTNSLRARFPGAKLIEMEQTSSAGAHLFSVNQPTTDSSSISMMEAADEFLETEWAVRMAKAHSDSGRKVCMFVRTLQSYGPLLEAAAKRIDLPLQMSRQEPLMTNPFARHCLTALKASATDSLPLLSSLVLTSYGNVARDERRAAANEIRVCAKAADRFAKLREKAEDKESPVPSWFAKLLAWRERALLSPATLSDWLIGLNKLISITPWLDMSAAGDTADRDNVAEDSMVRSLSVSKIAAEPTRLLTFAEFVDHCERIWLNADYWYRSHKGIKVVSSPWEIGDAEIVIALGIVEGRFPKRRAEDPILLDVDRAAINQKLGSDKLRSSYEKAEDDQREFYRLMCSAPNITLCYPLTFGESPEVYAAYLDELKGLFPAITIDKKQYENRFPLPKDASALSDLLPALVFAGSEAMSDEVAAITKDLSEAVSNSRSDQIASEEIRKQIADLPRPLRLAHLRSLRRCPFQYVARAKLGLQSLQPRWAWNRLADIVRRANLKAANVAELRSNLMNALAEELEDLKGRVTDDELELVAIAAPRALNAFAEREMAARQLWKIEPRAQNVALHEAGLSTNENINGVNVLFDERIDVVYGREGTTDLMPMRLAYVPDISTEDQDFSFETGLFLLLQKDAETERSAAIDSLQTGARRVMVRRKRDETSDLSAKANLHLYVDKSSENSKEIRKKTYEELKHLISIAARGNVQPIPGDYCKRCDYAAFCRRSPFGDIIQDRWDGLDE